MSQVIFSEEKSFVSITSCTSGPICRSSTRFEYLIIFPFVWNVCLSALCSYKEICDLSTMFPSSLDLTVSDTLRSTPFVATPMILFLQIMYYLYYQRADNDEYHVIATVIMLLIAYVTLGVVLTRPKTVPLSTIDILEFIQNPYVWLFLGIAHSTFFYSFIKDNEIIYSMIGIIVTLAYIINGQYGRMYCNDIIKLLRKLENVKQAVEDVNKFMDDVMCEWTTDQKSHEDIMKALANYPENIKTAVRDSAPINKSYRGKDGKITISSEVDQLKILVKIVEQKTSNNQIINYNNTEYVVDSVKADLQIDVDKVINDVNTNSQKDALIWHLKIANINDLVYNLLATMVFIKYDSAELLMIKFFVYHCLRFMPLVRTMLVDLKIWGWQDEPIFGWYKFWALTSDSIVNKSVTGVYNLIIVNMPTRVRLGVSLSEKNQ